MNAILNMPLRTALRTAGCYLAIGVILWMPVIAELLRAGR